MDGKISYRILDTHTPRYVMFSARFKRSYAYKVIQTELPVLITQIINTLTCQKAELLQRYGEAFSEEVKIIIGRLSHLKYQLQTNKSFDEFNGREPDKELWNNFLRALPAGSASFYRTCWIYAQCYLHRKISSFFENSTSLREYDYFEQQKHIDISVQHALKLVQLVSNLECNEEAFQFMLKLAMWGSRCQTLLNELEDKVEGQKTPKFLNVWNNFILANDSSNTWFSLTEYITKKPPIMVDIVCNYAGFELFIDFLLGDYLISKKLASKVRFHLKPIPWFVQQATARDVELLLKNLEKCGVRAVSERASIWRQYFTDSHFEIVHTNYFWISPYEYYKMREIDPSLYKYLSEAQLIIFKGDLNYRKLIGDYYWEARDVFVSCIRGFQPTNICSLRVLESEAICGLCDHKAEEVGHLSPKILLSGQYGLIQFAEGNECGCGI